MRNPCYNTWIVLTPAFFINDLKNTDCWIFLFSCRINHAKFALFTPNPDYSKSVLNILDLTRPPVPLTAPYWNILPTISQFQRNQSGELDLLSLSLSFTVPLWEKSLRQTRLTLQADSRPHYVQEITKALHFTNPSICAQRWITFINDFINYFLALSLPCKKEKKSLVKKGKTTLENVCFSKLK